MSDEEFDAERFVELAAALNRIELSSEQRPGVIINFKNFRSLHDLVAGSSQLGRLALAFSSKVGYYSRSGFSASAAALPLVMPGLPAGGLALS